MVLYDPQRDLAVLDVPGLNAHPLQFAGQAVFGASAIVAGYPLDDPFTVGPARLDAAESAIGPNIYQNSQVRRQIYPIRAQVRPGNSGGPLLAPDGSVYGVVFAAAVSLKDTGYALTAGEVASDAAQGQQRHDPGVDPGLPELAAWLAVRGGPQPQRQVRRRQPPHAVALDPAGQRAWPPPPARPRRSRAGSPGRIR